MFGLGGDSNELVVLGLLGLGIFAQNNELNLANNTTTLLTLLVVFSQREEIEDIRRELHCVEQECCDRCRHDRDCDRDREIECCFDRGIVATAGRRNGRRVCC